MSYSVNLEMVIKDKTLMAVTRLLAAELQQNPYLTVSDFFKHLSDGDVDMLIDVSEDDEDSRYGDIILMTEMLTAAEGVMVDEEDEDRYVEDITNRMRMFITFLNLESLERQGLVRVFRENMSFGEDYLDKLIAEPVKK